MAQTTRVDHPTALGALSDATEHFHTGHQINNSVLDINTQMTSGAWLGHAAINHQQAHQQIHEDVRSLLNLGLQYVEIAQENVKAQGNLDAGN